MLYRCTVQFGFLVVSATIHAPWQSRACHGVFHWHYDDTACGRLTLRGFATSRRRMERFASFSFWCVLYLLRHQTRLAVSMVGAR